MRNITLTVAAAAVSITLAPAGHAAELPGTVWATEGGDSRVRFELDTEGKLLGRFVWLRREAEEGVTVYDEENPDDTLKSRPLRDVEFVYGFEQDGDNWVDGNIYNPRNGRTYRSSIEPKDDGTLEVKGCVRVLGVRACQGQVWTPIAEEPS